MRLIAPLTLISILALAPLSVSACPQSCANSDSSEQLIPGGAVATDESSTDTPRGARGQRGPRGGGGFSPERIIERLDADGDGVLQVSELEGDRGQRLARADADEDGTLTVEELTEHFAARGWGPGSQPRRPQSPEAMMEQLDEDGDGEIVIDEVTNERRRDMLARADEDEDGAVTAEELQTFFESRRRLGPDGARPGPPPPPPPPPNEDAPPPPPPDEAAPPPPEF